MTICNNFYIFLYVLILYLFTNIPFQSFAQDDLVDLLFTQSKSITFCTTSKEEQNKCNALALAIERDSINNKMVCKQGANKDDCMLLLDQNVADLTTLDAGEVFIAGRYHSLVPIAQEVFSAGKTFHFSVAVVKHKSLPDVKKLEDLKGKKACFAAVGTLAGWAIPIYNLMKHGNMEIFDCNNHIKSAIKFFGPSCAVNSLIDKYNPIGDNSDKLCQLCAGEATGEKCTPNDPYYGYEGAFKCLVEKGDIAFLKHSTVLDVLKNPFSLGLIRNKNDFELLCMDGTRRPIDDYHNCNWGKTPSQAIVTSSAKTVEQKRFYQTFLQKLVQLYGGNFNFNNNSNFNNLNFNNFNENNYKKIDRYNNPYSSNNNFNQYERFHLFESTPRYGFKRNLLFQDNSNDIKALEEWKQTYSEFLGDGMKIIHGVRECPVGRMTLCVTSEIELEKCVKMKVAMKAQLLRPEMVCYKGHSQINCMQAIRNGVADVAVFDAGDIYTAGLNYELIPFMSEIYNLKTPEYYVVAVTKEEDPDTEITYLKGKYTCHTGINMAAGWVLPLAFLISNGWIRSYGCNSIRAAAEYFTKSCVPGAVSAEYNTGVPYDNMCDLCHGSSFRYCRRDASEDYFGHSGAFRCLVEGGGHVAFVKHTTVMENTGGKRKEFWARNTFKDEFELLCPDGTRGQIYDYKRCNLGKVKANAIVARGGYGYNETEINAYINLFLYAQQFYNSKDNDDFSFSMFSSPPPYSDLIFQDATTQLLIIPPKERYYSTYLGKNFMRAKRVVDCYASSEKFHSSVVLLFFSLFFSILALKKSIIRFLFL